jgi:O-glycosyl hydrolase
MSIAVAKSVILIVTFGIACSSAQESTVFVNPNVVVIENFEGWGTSLAWWPDILGAMAEDVITEVTTALFSPDKLNMNIVRYTIGGTTPDHYTCGPFRPGAATESFLDGPEMAYNWTRDPRQRDILQRAKVLGVDTFEAFSNSPPQWMTITGCSKGNAQGGLLHANFAADQADAFADYATEVIQHFKDTWGITFTTYAPFNEPFGLAGLGGWFGELSGQEGCNMARPVMATVLESMAAAMQRKGMDYVTLTAADETQMNTETASQNYFRANGVSHLIEKVNTHGYWDVEGNRRDRLLMGSRRDGHRLWMDEMGWAGTPVEDMSQGLIVANRIMVDLKKLLPSAWVYWQVVEGYGEWGLMNIPYDNPEATVEDIQYNSGYYAMMQFTKYIRKGYSILTVNDDNILAAYNGSTLVIVVINDHATATVQRSISLTLFNEIGEISATRTSPTEQNAAVTPAPTLEGTQLKFSTPPQSVTTVVISDAVHSSSGNLIKNGEFEDVALGDWTIVGGSTADGGIVTGENVWNGKSSGFLGNATEGNTEIRLVQTVKAPKDGVYYLTAWCATAAPAGSKLGVMVNNVQGPQVIVVGGNEFNFYAFSFAATQDADIQVYFAVPPTLGLSYVDDVSLYYQ